MVRWREGKAERRVDILEGIVHAAGQLPALTDEHSGGVEDVDSYWVVCFGRQTVSPIFSLLSCVFLGSFVSLRAPVTHSHFSSNKTQ